MFFLYLVLLTGSVHLPNFETGCSIARTQAETSQSRSQDSESESFITVTKLSSDQADLQHDERGNTMGDESDIEEDSGIGSATAKTPSRSSDNILAPGL